MDQPHRNAAAGHDRRCRHHRVVVTLCGPYLAWRTWCACSARGSWSDSGLRRPAEPIHARTDAFSFEFFIDRVRRHSPVSRPATDVDGPEGRSAGFDDDAVAPGELGLIHGPVGTPLNIGDRLIRWLLERDADTRRVFLNPCRRSDDRIASTAARSFGQQPAPSGVVSGRRPKTLSPIRPSRRSVADMSFNVRATAAEHRPSRGQTVVDPRWSRSMNSSAYGDDVRCPAISSGWSRRNTCAD